MDIILNKETGKEKYFLPTKWSQVKLGQFMEVQRHSENEELGDVVRLCKIVSALTGMSIKDIQSMPLDNLTTLRVQITLLLEKKAKTKLKNIININGTQYGFHPNLSKLTLGEFVDLESYIKQGVNQNLDGIMAVLYRPIIAIKGEKYDIEPYNPTEERKELFREHFTADNITGSSVFFLSLGKQLIKTMAIYSPQMMKHLKKRATQQTSSKDGDGIK